jgi:hypothetical protein
MRMDFKMKPVINPINGNIINPRHPNRHMPDPKPEYLSLSDSSNTT